ncbi:MAG TPA: branched-chain amino acid ABC transporter permease [Streptosporangiaceae bacterium]|nr:branched-chain amino acid ABC transporter permease [Streptosporangiaceae bacterium]
MSVFMPSVGFGLITAAVLAIAAVGFTLQFAVTNVLNLAFASIMTLAAFVAYWINQTGVSIWIALIASIAAGALISVALNYFVYSPFQRRGSAPITLVIVSLGMALILEFGTSAIVGGISVSYNMSQGSTVKFAGMILTTVQLIIIAISVVVMAGVYALLRYTKLGKAMRATAANRMLARNSGIRASRVIAITWALTGALCGLAGIVFAIDVQSFDPTSTDIFLILILAAVFLGGPGHAYGAMLGALVIGLATEVSAAYIQSDYKYVVAFVILLAMLAVRPTGLLGTRT